MHSLTEEYIGNSSIFKVVKPEKVTSVQHIMAKMQSGIAQRGAGLIFRKPGSKYMDHDSFLRLGVRCSNIAFLLLLELWWEACYGDVTAPIAMCGVSCKIKSSLLCFYFFSLAEKIKAEQTWFYFTYVLYTPLVSMDTSICSFVLYNSLLFHIKQFWQSVMQHLEGLVGILHHCLWLLKSDDKVSLAVVKRVRSDVTWDMLLRTRFPYRVERGKRSIASCRTCGEQFYKEDLRIQFEINRKLEKCLMPSCIVSVCMKLSCIQNAYRKSSIKPLVRIESSSVLILLLAPTLHGRGVCSQLFTWRDAKYCSSWHQMDYDVIPIPRITNH